MNDLVHAFRPSIFARERRYRLRDQTLLVDDGDAAERSVMLATVASIRIYRQDATKVGPAVRRAILHLASGETIVLQSDHYVRLFVIEDRAASYRAFVTALLERVIAAVPNVRVVVGHSWMAWMLWLVILAGAAVVLLAGGVMVAAAQSPLLVIPYLAIIVAFLPVTWRVVTKSRPRLADARALPAGILD
ncbi:MAG TPA: hypothetical protein VNE58_08935 [Casimicrobiaceae bacterium]|nr:hypothetical protein [Casimicrobiaceae bacterium]